MFGGKKKPEKEQKAPTKVTQVLINDLKGRRTVQHRFHNQNKKKNRPKKKPPEQQTKTKKKKRWKANSILTAIFLLSGIAATGTCIYTALKKPKEKIVYRNAEPPKNKKDIPRQKKITGYTIYLKNGKRKECGTIEDAGKGVIKITQGDTITTMTTRNIIAVTEKNRTGRKKQTRSFTENELNRLKQ